MKKYITICSAICLTVMVACEDATDILPVDAVAAEEALTTPSDIELALSGAFAFYSPQSIIQFSSRFTDDLRIGGNSGGQGVGNHNQVLNSGSQITNTIYVGYYRTINRCNRVLDAISQLDQGSLETEEVDRLREIQGQAFALRALSHFDLLSLYAPDFEGSSMGVPYIDFVVTLELPERNTVGEVFTGILSDLGEAETLISGTDKRFFTQNFITALRSKVALYRGDNAQAITQANTLISSIPLATRAQYLDMYLDMDDTEVIFKAARTVADARPGNLFFFNGGGAFFEMSFGLFSFLDPADVRYDALVDDDLDGGAVDPVSDPPNTIFIKKYPGRDGQFGLNDIKMYRVAEQYLIKAEAQAKMGDLNGAALTIDVLRDVRYGTDLPTPNYTSLQEAINAILDERRVELAYEGHRFIDLRRTRGITGVGIVRDNADCGGPTPCELAPTDFRFTLPIPQGEIDVNPNVTQNPGYGN